MKRRSEQLFKAVELKRKQDESILIANLDRWHAARETRFVKMFSSLTSDADCVQAVNNHIDNHDKNAEYRKTTLHNQWCKSIYDPIMIKVNQTINPLPYTKPMKPSIDPVKRQLTKSTKEASLSVAIDRLLFEHSPVRPPLPEQVPYPSRQVDPRTWSPAQYDGLGKKTSFGEIDADAAGTKS